MASLDKVLAKFSLFFLVTVIVYVFLLPASACTTILQVFKPTFNEQVLPLIILAFVLFKVAAKVTLVTLFSTVAL